MSYTKFAGRMLATTNHSPLRRYYIARNRVFLYRKYGRSVPGWMLQDLRSFVVEIAKILLLEQERWAKFRNIAQGTWHGLVGKMGQRGGEASAWASRSS
jgi:rhamnosyltransferase